MGLLEFVLDTKHLSLSRVLRNIRFYSHEVVIINQNIG